MNRPALTATRMAQTALAGAFLLFSGCAVGPEFQAPDRNALAGVEYLNQSIATGRSPEKGWWTQLKDPILNEYIEVLLTGNLTLQESFSRVEQARERVTIARGDLAPSVSGNPSGGRSFSSSALNPEQRVYQGNYDAQLSLSWQLDLFGKIRRSIESAKADVAATEADVDGVWQSLIAQLAQERISASVNQRLLQLATSNAENRRKILERVQRRYDLGTQNAEARDVYLAEDNYRSTQADLAEFRRLLTDNLYRIDILLGRRPGSVTVESASTFPLLAQPPPIPETLPIALLDSRPDLEAAELRLRAANADIGVAVADLYPNVSLSACQTMPTAPAVVRSYGPSRSIAKPASSARLPSS
ncbi:MAG: efflux transporter outer membrane subunit [Verrucomicrobiota bacterium]